MVRELAVGEIDELLDLIDALLVELERAIGDVEADLGGLDLPIQALDLEVSEVLLVLPAFAAAIEAARGMGLADKDFAVVFEVLARLAGLPR